MAVRNGRGELLRERQHPVHHAHNLHANDITTAASAALSIQHAAEGFSECRTPAWSGVDNRGKLHRSQTKSRTAPASPTWKPTIAARPTFSAGKQSRSLMGRHARRGAGEPGEMRCSDDDPGCDATVADAARVKRCTKAGVERCTTTTGRRKFPFVVDLPCNPGKATVGYEGLSVRSTLTSIAPLLASRRFASLAAFAGVDAALRPASNRTCTRWYSRCDGALLPSSDGCGTFPRNLTV